MLSSSNKELYSMYESSFVLQVFSEKNMLVLSMHCISKHSDKKLDIRWHITFDSLDLWPDSAALDQTLSMLM